MNKYDRDPWHDAETVPVWIVICFVVVLLLALMLGGCVHVKQGDFEYWRFGEQQIGEALLTLPDGSELLLDGQKSELPGVEITATSITIGGKKVGP